MREGMRWALAIVATNGIMRIIYDVATNPVWPSVYDMSTLLGWNGAIAVLAMAMATLLAEAR